jgi:DNA-binding transcriptional LysR family regulator
VELSVHPVADFPKLLISRTVDVALGPAMPQSSGPLVQQPFLAYEVLVVASPEHPVATGHVGLDKLADQTWHLGPGAVLPGGEASEVMRRLSLPEKRQRIFQSDAAALAETRRGVGLAIAVGFTIRDDLRSGRLVRIDASHLANRGAWSTWTLSGSQQPSASAELIRFVATPRATQAMVRGEAAGVGRFRPAVHVTLWS